jgi:carbonic anhydrase
MLAGGVSTMLSEYYRDKLAEIKFSSDIPRRWAGTPIEAFIQSQNFGYPLEPHKEPQLLISACMEFRFALAIPANYAYVIRTPGGRLVGSEFGIGYVLSRGVENILLIAHNDCGMTRISEHAPHVIEAFVQQGWNRARAEEYVQSQASHYMIKDELEGLENEYYRLKKLFKNMHVAPLFLNLADHHVHIPKWYYEFLQTSSN